MSNNRSGVHSFPAHEVLAGLACSHRLARMSGGYLQVSTTADSPEVAGHLAQSAVAAGLAASAQVSGPVASYFWHLGELGEGREWQVTLKTNAGRYAELEAHLIREHPWDNPEVSAVELSDGSAAYLAWLDRSTTENPSEPGREFR